MEAEREERHIYYDRDLRVEAYHLKGIVQKFPKHFHEYYVIGYIEGGRRRLLCKEREYDLSGGDLILFNPKDVHCCAPLDGEPLDYRAINISPAVLREAVGELTGEETLPLFAENVFYQSEIAPQINDLYEGIVENASLLKREETFFFLLEQLLESGIKGRREEKLGDTDGDIQHLCGYMETHFPENISLDQLAGMVGLSKSYLLRLFTRQMGVSPYRYLQTVRVDRAKKLLEKGAAPIDAAEETGFADQSHFTRFFKEFIGLTPKQYQRIFERKREEE